MATAKQNRRNEDIGAPEVRVIDSEGNQIGVLSREEALKTAEEAGLDLVEVVPNAEPPVCRVMDYGKFRFEQNKKAHSNKKKQKQTQIKEVKFRPNTDKADYDIKMRNVHRFLDEGDKVKITLRFRGREMRHQELGTQLLARVEQDTVEEAQVEQRPVSMGRLMVMMLAPRKK